MSTIQFRCIRCQHAVEAPKRKVGRKMYCPVCYLQLTVPEKSTLGATDPAMLYATDVEPADVRDMEERRKFRSLSCPVCQTNLAVRREQVGTEIRCEECETKIIVPPSFDREFDEKPPKIATKTTGDTYEVSGENRNDPNFESLIPVLCTLCATRMYAKPEQVGGELTCPDCGTKTRVLISERKPVQPPLSAGMNAGFEGAKTFNVAGDAQTSATQTSMPSREPLVPVVCTLCGTRMYARESEIGGEKICPDCGRAT